LEQGYGLIFEELRTEQDYFIRPLSEAKVNKQRGRKAKKGAQKTEFMANPPNSQEENPECPESEYLRSCMSQSSQWNNFAN